MSASQRRKGKRGELEAAALLCALYPLARQGRGGNGQAGECDVTATPWHVEVKYEQAPSPHAAMDQALVACDGKPPIVMSRKVGRKHRGKPWLVTVRWDDFVALVRAAAPNGDAEIGRLVRDLREQRVAETSGLFGLERETLPDGRVVVRAKRVGTLVGQVVDGSLQQRVVNTEGEQHGAG